LRADRQFAEQIASQKAIARMGMFRPSAMGVAGGGKKAAGGGAGGQAAIIEKLFGGGGGGGAKWAGPQPGDPVDYGTAPTESWIGNILGG
jgi:hypothetical protein